MSCITERNDGERSRRTAIANLRRSGANLEALQWPCPRPISPESKRTQKYTVRRQFGLTPLQVETRRDSIRAQRDAWVHAGLTELPGHKINRLVGGSVYHPIRRDDYQSAPDAREMTAADICNIEFLATAEEVAALKTAELQATVELTDIALLPTFKRDAKRLKRRPK